MENRYRSQNETTWNWFLRCGYDKVWNYIWHAPPTCPDLLQHPTRFNDALHLAGDLDDLVDRGVACDLEKFLRIRIHDEEVQRKAHLAAKKRLKKPHSPGYAIRRALMVLAYPLWADKTKIRAIYQEARARIEKDGPRSWHVDHIVPLNSRHVCGLHVHYNLRVIPARANLKKHNYFDEGLALAVN
jgi:hypothetical protein